MILTNHLYIEIPSALQVFLFTIPCRCQVFLTNIVQCPLAAMVPYYYMPGDPYKPMLYTQCTPGVPYRHCEIPSAYQVLWHVLSSTQVFHTLWNDTLSCQVFLLDSEFSERGMLFAFLAYFRNQQPVHLQVWSPTAARLSYDLKFSLRYVPSVDQLNRRSVVGGWWCWVTDCSWHCVEWCLSSSRHL